MQVVGGLDCLSGVADNQLNFECSPGTDGLG